MILRIISRLCLEPESSISRELKKIQFNVEYQVNDSKNDPQKTDWLKLMGGNNASW